jgi:imidazolonepropionase-like amidohydrolase
VRRAFLVGRLVDGTGAAPVERAMLLEDAGRIVYAGPRAGAAVPDGAEVLDAPSATLMPGLVDAHVHLAYSGSPQPGAFRAEAADLSYPALALRAARHARETLEWGFTAVRDLNAPGGVAIDLRDAINAGHVPGPRVSACGLGLTTTGGHMDPPGWGDHVRLDAMSEPCDGPQEFRRGVRRQVKRGADVIKINLVVGSRRDLRTPYRPEMTEEEVVAAIEEAHRLERRVAAHTSGGPAVLHAVRAGLDSVEHGHWIDEATADAIAECGAWYVPTLLVNERNFDFTREELGASAASWAWLEKSRDDKWASLERVRAAGARVATGTDAGFMLPHGAMSARELELLVKGGFSTLEAIRAATSNGADLLGFTDAGRLAPGMRADLLLVDGDPVRDVRVLQDAARLRVFMDGVEHTPPARLAAWGAAAPEGVNP